eukprot:76868_1
MSWCEDVDVKTLQQLFIDDAYVSAVCASLFLKSPCGCAANSSSLPSICIPSSSRANASTSVPMSTMSPLDTETERNALIDLYSATNGDNWTTSWQTVQLNWVKCNDEAHVCSIDLSSNGLVGTIPDSIGQLTDLHGLHLSHNNLRGTIPFSFRNLTKLTKIVLYRCNGLNGTIPDLFDHLPSLYYLDFAGNHLTGTIPDLTNLTILSYVDLADNQLTGNIPAFNNSETYYEIYVYDNQLEGTIHDSMGSLSALQVLFVHNNNLHGTIPDSFGELCSLEALSLFSNNLSGTIPLSLTQIKGLQHLLLHKNTFSCCMDAILSGFNGHNISSIPCFICAMSFILTQIVHSLLFLLL